MDSNITDLNQATSSHMESSKSNPTNLDKETTRILESLKTVVSQQLNGSKIDLRCKRLFKLEIEIIFERLLLIEPLRSLELIIRRKQTNSIIHLIFSKIREVSTLNSLSITLLSHTIKTKNLKALKQAIMRLPQLTKLEITIKNHTQTYLDSKQIVDAVGSCRNLTSLLIDAKEVEMN